MALIETAGATNADTYATLAEAQAYMDSLAYKAAWASATQAAREGALRSACRKLDLCSWKGTKTTGPQALEWPRYGVTDRSGYSIEASTIPTWLKNAQAEQALRELEEDRGSDPALGQPSRVKAGPIEVEMGQGTRKAPALLSDLVLQMVSPYLSSPVGSVVRLVRA